MVQKRIVSSMLKTLKCPKPTNNQTNKKEKKPQNQKTKPTTKKKSPKTKPKLVAKLFQKSLLHVKNLFLQDCKMMAHIAPISVTLSYTFILLIIFDYIVLGSEPINSIYRTGFLVQLLLILVLTPRNQKVLFNLILQEFQRWSLR